MIPYGRQDIDQSDIDAVVRILRSDFLTQGPAVPRFEAAVASLVKAEHAIAVNSATSALHVACIALGLGKGDLLWTTPNTYVASANCARFCGADVDFVDIDSLTWNMSVPALEQKLAEAERTGRLPKVVIPVHFAGQATDQEAIFELGQRYGFAVLEDASHSIGADRNGEPVGSCRWSDITVFSFHPVKVITSGEGGMALTNDESLAESMRLVRSHGITRDASRFVNIGVSVNAKGSVALPAPPTWYYEQQVLGFNYRMTDIQAGLGTSQLRRLPAHVQRRVELAKRYSSALAGLPLKLPTVKPENQSAFHLYVVRVRRDATAMTHREVFDGLQQRGIGVNVHYMPVHLQPYYRQLGFTPGRYPEAEAHGEEAITLPLFSAMAGEEQDQVIDAILEVFKN